MLPLAIDRAIDRAIDPGQIAESKSAILSQPPLRFELVGLNLILAGGCGRKNSL